MTMIDRHRTPMEILPCVRHHAADFTHVYMRCSSQMDYCQHALTNCTCCTLPDFEAGTLNPAGLGGRGDLAAPLGARLPLSSTGPR